MDSIGMFDVAVAGDAETGLRKQAQLDKLAAATYDVREAYGSWLFGAHDQDAFNDRAKLAYVDICKTIEPHIHARKGVYEKVMKTIKAEWRQKQACYPGCEENEAHASKFHKDKSDDDTKEARKWQASEYTDSRALNDPQRAHDVLDKAQNLHHDNKVFERAHEIVDERGQKPQQPDLGLLGDELGAALGGGAPAPEQYGNGEPINQHAPGHDPNLNLDWQDGTQHQASVRARQLLAEFEDQPDHPEQHIQETFQDHQGEELKPEGNFDSYKDRVDQGGPEKVDSHAFTAPDSRSSSPYSVEEHNDNGDHNFVNTVTGSREFAHIARMIQAVDLPAPGAPGAGGAGAPGAAAPDMAAAGGAAPPPAMTSDSGSAGTTPGAGATPAAAPTMPMTASREFQFIASMLHEAAPGALGGAPAPATPIEEPSPIGGGLHDSQGFTSFDHGIMDGTMSPAGGTDAWVSRGPKEGRRGRVWAAKMIREVGTKQARVRLINAGRRAKVISAGDHKALLAMYSFRHADRNYLQQADESLTKVLNEKAEEFQNTIAPLQQALITIQEAEALTNPLNVSPPAGTVNVLPGQQGQAGAGAAPAAPAPDPTGGSVAPQGAGGVGADPAAAALAAPQQLAAGRNRGGHPKGR